MSDLFGGGGMGPHAGYDHYRPPRGKRPFLSAVGWFVVFVIATLLFFVVAPTLSDNGTPCQNNCEVNYP